MRDYLQVSADAAVKVHDFAMRSPNPESLVANNTTDTEIRLAKEQLKLTETKSRTGAFSRKSSGRSETARQVVHK